MDGNSYNPHLKYRMARNNWENYSDFDHQYLDYRLCRIQRSVESDSNWTSLGILQFLCRRDAPSFTKLFGYIAIFMP